MNYTINLEMQYSYPKKSSF